MQSLMATNDVCTLPVYRPLIGFDKQEIVDVSEKIDTYETSIQPFEDCCTIFVAKHPVTKGNLKRIKKSEEHLEDVIDDYYKRVKSYYLYDVVTKEKRQFYSLQDVAKFLRRKDYRSISKYIDRGLLIARTSYKIYKYRTFKKRKRF